MTLPQCHYAIELESTLFRRLRCQSKRPEVERLARLSAGLATNLHELAVPDTVIQAILLHEDVKNTRSYIKTVPSGDGGHEAKIACAADVQ